MPIELTASGFREWRDRDPDLPGVGIETARLDDCIDYYHRGKFRGVFGTPSYGFDQDNLDFLARVKNARWIWFWDVSLKNVEALYELSELEDFGVHPKRPGIDFSRFPVLNTVVNHWIKADFGLVQSNIKNYHLWHYKPTTKSFSGLEIPLGTRHLDLTWANPSSLAGLPILKKLKRLEFHRCRNLSDLSLLPEIAPNLETLLTTTSSKIDATAGVLDHPKLKTALISGKFVVGNGG